MRLNEKFHRGMPSASKLRRRVRKRRESDDLRHPYMIQKTYARHRAEDEAEEARKVGIIREMIEFKASQDSIHAATVELWPGMAFARERR